jgi:hypothetical protein
MSTRRGLLGFLKAAVFARIDVNDLAVDTIFASNIIKFHEDNQEKSLTISAPS